MFFSNETGPMLAYITNLGDAVLVRLRPRGEGLVGDAAHLSQVVSPGETFYGITYEELSRLPDGEHDLPLDYP